MTTAVQHSRQPSPASFSAPDQQEPPHPKYWKKEEYNALVDQGVFEGQRVYLFRGELIEMPAMKNPHAVCVMKSTSLLVKRFPVESFFVRVQLPFNAPGESVPEPDFAICTHEQAFLQPHPNAAALVIEVSDTSLMYDREKALEYAAAGVPEYWIIDLADRCVEIYRNPAPDRSVPLGFSYPPPTVATENDPLSPLALPEAYIKVVDLLP